MNMIITGLIMTLTIALSSNAFAVSEECKLLRTLSFDQTREYIVHASVSHYQSTVGNCRSSKLAQTCA